MKLRICTLIAIAAFATGAAFDSVPAQAQFTQQGPKLVGTGYAPGPTPLQGISVAVSADGNTLVSGGSGNNDSSGAAWVFTRSGGVWSQQTMLVGANAIGPYSAQQGISVAISNDGNTIIMGGRGDNGFIGAAWVFTRSDGVWTQEAKLVGTGVLGPGAGQGFSVSLSGDGNTAIVGGLGDNDSAGAAWVFTRSGIVWSEQAKLVATNAIGKSSLGCSVSLSADGNTALVGGFSDNDSSGNNYIGAAWVFTRSKGGVWTQEAKLVGTGATRDRQGQGTSVSISADGNTAISAAPFAGASWVFTRSNGIWSQQAELAEVGSVALSRDGNTAIVGANCWFCVGDAEGALVFTRANGVWAAKMELVGTDAIGNAEQGFSVALSPDGNIAVLGGRNDNGGIGAAWVFNQPMFAGTPGYSNCYGKSASALAQQYGGLNNAATALGYPSASALQNVIMTFCEA
jgi:hypothetical protein